MKPTVIHKPQARIDLLDCGHHIAKDDLDAAIRFIDAFDETVEDLARMPGLGNPWESARPQFRSMRWRPVKGFPKHLIFYREIDDGIEVIRVCHGSRDLESLFG